MAKRSVTIGRKAYLRGLHPGCEPFLVEEARLMSASIRLGQFVLVQLPDLLAPDVAALLADVDGHAEACGARLLDHWHHLFVVVATAVGPRAGDVHADDATRRPADRLLDDDRVQVRAKGAVHHQDQSGAYLRILEARAVETSDGGEDDVVEVTLAAAVSLHR